MDDGASALVVDSITLVTLSIPEPSPSVGVSGDDEQVPDLTGRPEALVTVTDNAVAQEKEREALVKHVCKPWYTWSPATRPLCL